MCNLYSLTKGQAAILEMTRAMVDRTGNLPPLPGIFPDYPAPIVRNGAEGRELAMARWGMPSPVFALKGRKTDPGVTNVRNVSSPHWRRWLGAGVALRGALHQLLRIRDAARTARSAPSGSRLTKRRPLAFFAGIWTRWTSVRKVKEGETTNDLFAFLTCEANAEVGAIHPKAMPVILTQARRDRDLAHCASTKEALQLQRPLADGTLRIVARGEKQDG